MTSIFSSCPLKPQNQSKDYILSSWLKFLEDPEGDWTLEMPPSQIGIPHPNREGFTSWGSLTSWGPLSSWGHLSNKYGTGQSDCHVGNPREFPPPPYLSCWDPEGILRPPCISCWDPEGILPPPPPTYHVGIPRAFPPPPLHTMLGTQGNPSPPLLIMLGSRGNFPIYLRPCSYICCIFKHKIFL